MEKRKLPNLVSILVLTLITTLMWISLNIYRSLTTEAPPSVPKEISDPLTPTLDKDAINQIEGKLFLDDSQIPNVVASGTSVPSPVPTPVNTPIETSTPVPEGNATPSPTP